MRRVIASLTTVVMASFAVGAPAASASPTHKPKQNQRDRSLNRQVTGPYAGIQTFDFGTGGCVFVHQVFVGTYQSGPHKSGSFRIDVCVVLESTQASYTGTFELTTARRVVLSGTVTGASDIALPVASLDLVLTVTAGTWHGRAVSGTIALAGTWANDPPDTLGRGPTSGALTGAMSTSRI